MFVFYFISFLLFCISQYSCYTKTQIRTRARMFVCYILYYVSTFSIRINAIVTSRSKKFTFRKIVYLFRIGKLIFFIFEINMKLKKNTVNVKGLFCKY